MNPNPVKTTLVCGFLGAGKTTFIKGRLTGSHKRTAVLVNEFGTLGMDGDDIARTGLLDVIEIPGGCICCSQNENLRDTVEEIVREIRPDRLLIEPSGVAEASAVIKALTRGISPGMIRLENVITLVAADTFLDYVQPDAFGAFFMDQLVNADTILINKVDRISPETLGEIRGRIERFNDSALILPVSFGIPGQSLEGARRMPLRESLFASPKFDFFSIRPSEPLDRGKLKRLGENLKAGRFGRIQRAKGLFDCTDGKRRSLQYAGNALSIGESPSSLSPRITLIGLSLDRKELEQFFSGPPSAAEDRKEHHLTPHRRLFKAVNKEPVDRVPLICPGGMMTMAVVEAMDLVKAPWPEAHQDAKLMADLTEGMARLSGIENLGVPFCMTIEAEEMGATVDLGNRTREPHVTRFAMDSMAEMERLTAIDPEKGRARVCCDAIRLLKELRPDLPILGNLSGPVSLATSLVDPLLYYRAIRRNKELVHDLTDFCTDQAILFGEAMVRAGADMICIADPSATGDLLGPAAFEEFVLPQLNRMARRFQEELDVPVIVHICGKVKGTGELLAKLAAKVISVDSVVGLSRLSELVPDKVTMGNVSTFTLERGTPDKVAKAGLACIRQGVGILAPACGIAPLTPLANIRSLANILAEAPAHNPLYTDGEESNRAQDNL